MDDAQPTHVLSTGRLDGLTMQPVGDADGKVTHIHCTIATLPGVRLIIEAEAAAELRDALMAMLQMGWRRATGTDER